MSIADYEQALTLVRRLDRPTQARLIAQIVQELAAEPVTPALTLADHRATLAEVRAHFAAQGAVSPSIGEQVERDRQDRAAMLEGHLEGTDVYG